jgi:outer membrane protein assembly factor BamE (lipoprotein component of BamABCDE complex)
MTRTLPIVLTFLALLSPSCFTSRTTVNAPVHGDIAASFVPGQTTAKDVVEKLGAPAEVVQLGSRTAYRYDYTVEKRSGFTLIIVSFLNEDTRSDRVWLFFDAKDVLTHAGATLEAADARYAMPWQETHAK